MANFTSNLIKREFKMPNLLHQTNRASDIFIETLHKKLIPLNPEINFVVKPDTNSYLITFNLDNIKPYYMFQIELAAKTASLSLFDLRIARRGNNAEIKVKL